MQAALRSVRRKTVAADNSKLGKVAFASVCGWQGLASR
jgi:DeoR/GlpR family transcriptional regulator of sugar metabolism